MATIGEDWRSSAVPGGSWLRDGSAMQRFRYLVCGYCMGGMEKKRILVNKCYNTLSQLFRQNESCSHGIINPLL